MSKRYLAGYLWSAANALASVVIPLGVFVYFARALPPWQVGVVAHSLAWVEIIKIFAPLGLYEALVSTDDYDAVAAPAGTLLGCAGLAAFVAYAGVMVAAPLWMPAAKSLLPIALALGVRIIFDLMAIQPQAAIARRMDFKRLGIRSLVANVGAAAGGAAVGMLTTPLYGLIAYYVLQSMILWLTTVAGTSAVAPLSFAWGKLGEIARTSFVATQVRSLATINNFADQAISAVFVGPSLIAHYNLGKRVEIAQITAASSFSSILFQPLFARRDDDSAIAPAFQQSLRMMTLLCGLPTALFVVNAHALILQVFGPHWQEAAPVAMALALGGLARAIGGVSGAYMSVNNQNSMLRNRSIVSAVVGVSIVCLTGWIGLAAMAWLLAIKNGLITVWLGWGTRKLAPTPVFLWTSVGLPLVFLASAWAGSAATQALVPIHTMLDLAIVMAASGVACALGAAVAYRRELGSAMRLVRTRARSL